MASIVKRDGARGTSYKVTWREAGKQQSRTVSTYREAQTLKADTEHRLARGVTLTGDRYTVAEWYDLWSASRTDIRESTAKANRSHYVNHIKPALGHKQVRDVQPLNVQQVINSASHLAPATVRRIHAEVVQMFKAATEARVIQASPVSGIKLPKMERRDKTIFDHHEIDVIAETVPEQYRVLVYVLAYGGLRVNEALALKVANYDGTSLHVKGSLKNGRVEPPKTSAGVRVVPLPQSVRVRLDKHIDGRKPGDWMFTGPRGAVINANNFQTRIFKRAAARGTVHDLRHTAITHWIRAGVDLPRIAAWAGHTDPSFTLRQYAGYFAVDNTQHMDALDASISSKRPNA